MSNEAFYYLNCNRCLPLSVLPLPHCMYTPIYTALGSGLLFLPERKRTRQPYENISNKIPSLWISWERLRNGRCQSLLILDRVGLTARPTIWQLIRGWIRACTVKNMNRWTEVAAPLHLLQSLIVQWPLQVYCSNTAQNNITELQVSRQGCFSTFIQIQQERALNLWLKAMVCFSFYCSLPTTN